VKSPRMAETGIRKKPGNWIRCGWMLVLLTLFAGCVHVPVSSDIVVNARLEASPPLEPGDVVVVYGENAAPPEQNAAVTYFTAGCQGAFHGNTLGELAKTILKMNPQPGRFAVRYANKLQKEEGAGPSAEGPVSVRALPDLSQDKFSAGRPRYAVHVREQFEASVHVPLYVSPFGVASCSNKTILEARVWDLPAERFLGSFTVTAEGEFTVVAYMLHMVVSPDTQKDAMEKLAQEIVARLTGLKPLENKDD
jgi:hypothetical protein